MAHRLIHYPAKKINFVDEIRKQSIEGKPVTGFPFFMIVELERLTNIHS